MWLLLFITYRIISVDSYEWHIKHWNENDYIDDKCWANEMEEYYQYQLKL